MDAKLPQERPLTPREEYELLDAWLTRQRALEAITEADDDVITERLHELWLSLTDADREALKATPIVEPDEPIGEMTETSVQLGYRGLPRIAGRAA